MTAKRIAVVFVWTLAAVLGLDTTRNVVSRLTANTSSAGSGALPAAGPAPEGLPIQPYTVVFDLSQKAKPDAKPDAGSQTSLRVIAVRSDGSVVQQLEIIGGPSPMSSRLIKLASGPVITTNDILERKHTPSATSNVPLHLRDPRSRCLKTFAGTPPLPGEELLAEEQVAGRKAVKIGIKQRGETFWYAPDLGCAELKSRVVVQSSGQVLEQIFASVTPGEPDASLFHVPASYAEVPRERLGGR